MAKASSIILAISVALVVAAFWPLYLSRPFAEVDRFTHLHAAAGSLWLALLIAQPAAIHTRRFMLHRVLGRFSYVAAPVFALSAVLLSHHRLVSMNEATLMTDGYSHYLPFYATLVFSVAYALGVIYRNVPLVHARFMLCTAVPMVDPVLGRVLAFYLPPLPSPWLYQVITFGLATVVAGLLVFSYRAAAAPRRALVGYFGLLVALEIAWFTFALTGLWLNIVRWFRSLPLP